MSNKGRNIPARIPKAQALRDTFLILKDDKNQEVKRVISTQDFQIGLKDQRYPGMGLILQPHDRPANIENSLYNENGTLKFSGRPLTSDVSGSIEAVTIAADGGTITGDTTITFTSVNETLGLKAGTNVTLAGDAANRTILVTASGASSAGGWTDDGSVVRLTTATDRVGIGTANPQDQVHIENSDAAASIELDRNDSDISTGNTLGNVYFGGTENGTTYDYGATIRAVADGAWTVGSDIPTRLEFWTVPDGSSTQTLRMRMRQDSTIETYGSVLPGSDSTHDLGSLSRRWANIYTGDLHLKNERGHWQIVEEADCLMVINRLTSKKYKMVLEPCEDE